MGASSNRTGVALVKEVSWGVNPGTALKDTNFEGESLSFNVESITSNSIRNDRQVTDLIQTGADCSGGLNVELQYGGSDEFIIGALFSDGWVGVGGGAVETLTSGEVGSNLDFDLDATGNTITLGSGVTHAMIVDQWFQLNGSTTDDGFHQVVAVAGQEITVTSITTTEVLDESDTATISGSYARNGTTRSSFYIERSHEDITQYFQYAGMVVNTMSLDFSASSVLKSSFNFIGKSATNSQTTEGTGSNDAAETTEYMNSVSNVGDVNIDGTAASSCLLQKVGIEINNNVRGLTSIGNLGFCGVSEGEANISGSLDMYFKDEVMYDKYLASTAFSLSIRVTSNNNDTYIFSLPSCKLNADTINASGKNSDVMENATFQAIMGSEGYTFQIDKIPSP